MTLISRTGGIVHVLPPGRNRIQCPPVRGDGHIAGLVPLQQPCEQVTTEGLRWELAQQRLAMGGLISSSNRVVRDEVCVHTSHPLLWILCVSEPAS